MKGYLIAHHVGGGVNLPLMKLMESWFVITVRMNNVKMGWYCEKHRHLDNHPERMITLYEGKKCHIEGCEEKLTSQFIKKIEK